MKWCLFTSYTISRAVDPAEASYFSLLPGYLTNPTALFEDIKLINEYGTWTFGRNSASTVNGVVLTVIWIAEFLIYAIIHLVVVNSKTATPFIEKDNKWAKKSDVRFYCRDFNVKAELSRIETDPSLLLSFLEDPQKISTAQYVVIELYHSSDFTENYIDIIRVSITNAAQNKKSETTLVKKLAVNREIAQSLYAQHNMTLPV